MALLASTLKPFLEATNILNYALRLKTIISASDVYILIKQASPANGRNASCDCSGTKFGCGASVLEAANLAQNGT